MKLDTLEEQKLLVAEKIGAIKTIYYVYNPCQKLIDLANIEIMLQ